MFPPINTFSGFMIFAAFCCVGGAGGLYVRNSRLSAHSCPVLNKAELRLFAQLRRASSRCFGDGYFVMAQVSYGEFLSTTNRKLFFRFNCKRADFLVMDQSAQPIIVIEYQGSGHFGWSLASRFKAMRSDRVKRKLLHSAGIPFLEVPAQYRLEYLDTFFNSVKREAF